ncbi:MAG: 50S ribosomal protein L4 [Cryomorphaceae bacterium]|nr:MAG: 50S ribosomal protein L4 [Cryomorphaceae bacterium]
MELKVLNIEGKETSKKVKLDDAVFGVEPNDHAIYLDVKQYLANQRQGTHATKGRSDVKGSTRKLRKQKGTGGARVGDIKNPLFRGGGRIFGPQPRDYSFKLNKKSKAVARKSALSYKAKDQNLLVVEDFKMESPKTKQFAGILGNLKVSTDSTLWVLAENDKNVVLSARNIPQIKVVMAKDLNTYDILKYKKMIVSERSLAEIQQTLNK